MATDHSVKSLEGSLVAAAIILYGEWAEATGDYPHDERGCEAHQAIMEIYSLLKAAK